MKITSNKMTRISTAEHSYPNNVAGYSETHSAIWKSFEEKIPDSSLKKLNAQEIVEVAYALHKAFLEGRSEEYKELKTSGMICFHDGQSE